jgi:hypothetical protein
MKSLKSSFTLLALALVGSSLAPAGAQSINSATPVTINSGLLFEINNVAIGSSNLNLIGSNGTYRLGFATSGDPIVVTFDQNASGFGGAQTGDQLEIERIGAIYLAGSNVAATLGGNTLYNQAGTATSLHFVTNSAGDFTGFADDSTALFTDAKSFLASSDSEGSGGNKPRFGDFAFSSATHVQSLALDVMGVDLNNNTSGTGRILITGFSDPNSVPEPGTLALLVGMGLSASTFAFRRRRHR